MSPVDAISGLAGQPFGLPSVTTTQGGQPGKEQFLQLLVTELRHQDPLNPMQDREFITQLAQFNALEEMQKVNKSIEAFTATQDVMAAAGFLGKTVEYHDPADLAGRNVLSGQVSRVSWSTGTPKLMVGEREVDLTQIVSVR
jgi:flagellar basal-body rod modification protein FlgD